MAETLFHYTDIGAVSSILRNKKFWLTHVEFLNDSEELHDGIKHIKECLLRMEKISGFELHEIKSLNFIVSSLGKLFDSQYEASPIFTCSFSRSRNLLSQWRAYGNFALEFDRTTIESDFDLYECLYESNDKELEARRLIDAIHHRFANLSDRSSDDEVDAALEKYFEIVYSVGKFKNTHFSAEKEVRIVRGVDADSISYRAKSDYLVPYVEASFNISAVKAIHIGPIADQKLAERSLRCLLKTIGLPDLEIVKSDIPYRS